jgi:hypothetical protein
MPREQFSVFVLCNEYRVMDSPDVLRDEGRPMVAFIDHVDRVIWVSPAVPAREKLGVVARAVSRAWQERLDQLAAID